MKKTKKRVFLIVLDSLGAGEAPDAERFGDVGSFTLKSCFETGKLEIPNLCRMGLGAIEGLSFLGECKNPIAAFGKMREASEGKDTTIGHWEIAGHISEKPLPTFPHGFPEDFMEAFSRKVGRGWLCNAPYSGTAVIQEYGEEHLRTGKLIVYTSADSVFQVAAHTDKVPLNELYSICETAREMLTGELGVGRVIARPFEGHTPNFRRTADRRDYSLMPPVRMLTDAVYESGFDSISVGKIVDIFAGRGFTESIRTHSNQEGMEALSEWAKKDFCGLCFANLVDFDSLWGHRRDAEGYARGLSSFDAWLDEFLPLLRKEDLLIITADHGCDPRFTASTDHTREYVPLLVYGADARGKSLGIRNTFADVAATVASILELDFSCDGRPI
ncbi:MAG: phosphopentomutase [Clostridia bacterium]|nr:phosphopentomutase [Clostridia bacterium]